MDSITNWDFTLERCKSVTGRTNLYNTIQTTCRQEYYRYQELTKIRHAFDDDCRKLLNIRAPREAFNRFLYAGLGAISPDDTRREHDIDQGEQLTRQPLLALGDVLRNELTAETPSRCDKNKFADLPRAHRVISTYLHSARAFFTTHRTPEFQTASNELQLAQIWYRKNISNPDLQAHTREYIAIRDLVQPVIMGALAENIDAVCRGVYDRVRALNAGVQSVSSEPCVISVEHAGNQTHITMSIPDTTTRDVIVISRVYYDKLQTLHEHDRGYTNFHEMLYMLLRRYETCFSSINQHEGSGFHAAIPGKTMKVLHEELGVCMEVFASPLNCYFPTMYSAFRDTDRCFGSNGSFFDTTHLTGSFECNPPFLVQVMDDAALHIQRLLTTAQPLSFVVYVPNWTDPPARYTEIFEKSRYLRARHILPGGTHVYTNGVQHVDNSIFRAAHETALYVLQNTEGTKKYPVTAQKMKRIIDSQRH